MTKESVLPEKQWMRLYARELGAVMVAYAVVLVASIAMVKRTDGALRYVVVMVPMIPVGLVGLVVLRGLKRVDERERLLSYRAITFSFFWTGFVTFSYGFLEGAGAPKVSMFAVWPLMATLWVLGRFVAPRMP